MLPAYSSGWMASACTHRTWGGPPLRWSEPYWPPWALLDNTHSLHLARWTKQLPVNSPGCPEFLGCCSILNHQGVQLPQLNGKMKLAILFPNQHHHAGPRAIGQSYSFNINNLLEVPLDFVIQTQWHSPIAFLNRPSPPWWFPSFHWRSILTNMAKHLPTGDFLSCLYVAYDGFGRDSNLPGRQIPQNHSHTLKTRTEIPIHIGGHDPLCDLVIGYRFGNHLNPATMNR